MKRFFPLLTLSVFLASAPLVYIPAGIALAGLATGCKTANTAAYKATGAVVVTVDAAMSAWGDYVRTSHPPVAQEIAVKDAFEKYKAAALTVTSAGAAHAKVLATQGADPTSAASALNAAIAISSAALGDLIALIQKFGVKI
jgi:hypothetical protein